MSKEITWTEEESKLIIVIVYKRVLIAQHWAKIF